MTCLKPGKCTVLFDFKGCAFFPILNFAWERGRSHILSFLKPRALGFCLFSSNLLWKPYFCCGNKNLAGSWDIRPGWVSCYPLTGQHCELSQYVNGSRFPAGEQLWLAFLCWVAPRTMGGWEPVRRGAGRALFLSGTSLPLITSF